MANGPDNSGNVAQGGTAGLGSLLGLSPGTVSDAVGTVAGVRGGLSDLNQLLTNSPQAVLALQKALDREAPPAPPALSEQEQAAFKQRMGVAPVAASIGPAAPVTPAAPRPVARALPALPSALQPEAGVYPVDYSQRVESYVAAGGDPKVAQRALSNFAQFQKSEGGIGLERARMAAGVQAGELEGQAGVKQYESGTELLMGEHLAQAERKTEQMQAEWEKFSADHLAAQQKRIDDMDKLQSEIQATRIDPSEYWAKQSGLSKVLSVIAVGLGGAAQGLSGGRLQNTALQLIQQEIDRDIEAQKANLASRKGNLEQMRGVYGVAQQRFGDEMTAKKFTEAQMWSQAETAMKRLAGTIRSEAGRAAAADMLAKAAAIRADVDLSAKQNALRAQREATQAAMYARSPEALRRIRGLEADIALKEAKAAEAAAKGGYADKEGFRTMIGGELVGPRYVPEAGVLVASPQEAKDLRDKVAAKKRMASLAYEGAKLADENPVAVLKEGTAAASRYGQIISELSALQAVSTEQGAMSGAEADTYRRILGAENILNKSTALKQFGASVLQSQRDLVGQSTGIRVQAKATPEGIAVRVDPNQAATPGIAPPKGIRALE